MVLRRIGATSWGAGAAAALERFNTRHPWSHNDHFHGWILSHLPAGRASALDVGCGRGELAASLAAYFTSVTAADRDGEMRRVTTARCLGLPNVTVTADPLERLPGSYDLVTMISVLHHLDLRPALEQVRRLLAPGGRFLVVGHAVPHGPMDQLWDTASIVTNPVVGYVRHPWVADPSLPTPDFPVKDPELTLAQIRKTAREILPGADIRWRLGFRFTLAWTAPG